MLELYDFNVVVTARVFNPSVIGQHWLVRNAVVGEDDFRPGCVFLDGLSQVQTEEFSLVVVPQRLQFSPRVPDNRKQELIIEKVGRIVAALPHTPYEACGLNITWHLTPEEIDTETFCRRLFFRPDDSFYETFDEDGALFGAYFSKDSIGCRMKLDVKPINLESDDDREWQCVQFAFNFHIDLENAENAVGLIVEMLHRWDDASVQSAQIMRHAMQRDIPCPQEP